MTDIFWIKLKVNMFDDEKVKLIEQMPEGDAILVILIKLLLQAGKSNANGYIFLSENIPFTPEMLSTVFNKSLPIVKLAIKTLEQLGMICIVDDGRILINNWGKHQNVEGMEKVRELACNRQKRFREKQKKLLNSSNVTSEVDKEKATPAPMIQSLPNEEEIIKALKSTENNDSVTSPNVTITKQNKSKSKNNKIYSPNSNEFRLAQLLFELLRDRNSNHKEPDIQKWSKHIDLMIRLDKRDPSEIENVIRWAQSQPAQSNGFTWANNILSTQKLREKYDQLILVMNSNINQHQNDIDDF